ncbi:DUF6350 family protein [Demequina sp. SYSU T00192]|uniref:DUF6350 family protein n=1 Tax=Demequina litoralis TaxID=3051660 RepID=A0ABT8G768_9MICO|nr:DUF6350 family protein [Demequina sp. SYSU T00192]MDN4474981.1 DUF6350 family protein [Demequina sp. SYSU T00192]
MPADAPRPARLDRLRAALPGWAGGVLTGGQAVLLSYLVVLAPALAAVAGAPSLDGSAAVDWPGAATVATSVWLLGHGVPIDFAGATLSLVPLGMPLVSAVILAAVARRFAVKTWTSWALGVASFSAGAALVGWLGSPDGSREANALRAALVGALIAAPAVAAGIWRAYGARLHLLDRIPSEVRAGLRLGLGTLALVVAAAAAVGGAWAVLGMDRIALIASDLRMDPLGAGALAIAETLYVPTLVCWMVAWLVGPGFVVGTGSLYAPDTLTADALPQLPLLGALPSGSGGWWTWAPLVVVVLAAVARAALSRRIGLDWASARAAGVAIAVVAAGLATLTAVSRGAAGPGRLAQMGAEIVPVTLIGTALVVAGYGAVWALAAAWRWVRGAVRRDDAPAPAAEPVREPAGRAR